MDSTRDQLRGQPWSQDSGLCLRKWRLPSFCRRRSRDKRGPTDRNSSSCPRRCRIWKNLSRFSPIKKIKKKKWGGREEGKGSPGNKDTYVEVIRMICVLGVQLVGPRGETGQCIFGVGTNGQIYLRENHFEMDRNHFVVAGVRTNLCFEIFNPFASW